MQNQQQAATANGAGKFEKNVLACLVSFSNNQQKIYQRKQHLGKAAVDACKEKIYHNQYLLQEIAISWKIYS